MKKTVKLVSNAALLVLLLSLTGCYYDDVVVREIPVIEEDVSFVAEIQPIFNDNNCMQCHPSIANLDLREGSSYASLVPDFAIANDSEGSRLYAKLVDGHRSVSTAEIALIKAWIDQGAQNN